MRKKNPYAALYNAAPCSSCKATLRYKRGGECVSCKSLELLPLLESTSHPRNSATARGLGLTWHYTIEPFVCLNAPHLRAKSVTTQKCVHCHGNPKDPSRREARLAGRAEYSHFFPCIECGSHGRSTVDNKCTTCRPIVGIKSSIMHSAPNTLISKKDAKAEGHRVYRTGRACHKGHTGWRRVDNGSCIDCTAGRPVVRNAPRGDSLPDGRTTATTAMMRQHPEMCLSRADAQAMGLTVYRTGKSCPQGHTGWRRVKGLACIDCTRR